MLHRLFDAAEDWEYREGNPVGKVKPPKCDDHDAVILTDEQYDRLLAECDAAGPMLHLYALFLGETGARAYSETLHVQFEDVDLEDGYVRLVSGRDGHRLKSGKSRWTPMTPRLRQAMREHFAAYRFAAYDGQRSPWVFHHSQSRVPIYKAGDRLKDLRGGFDRAVKRAKLPQGFRRHDLRHRRVTTWLKEGKSAAKVQKAMGHSDLATTMGYSHLVKEDLRSLVESDEQVGAKQERG